MEGQNIKGDIETLHQKLDIDIKQYERIEDLSRLFLIPEQFRILLEKYPDISNRIYFSRRIDNKVCLSQKIINMLDDQQKADLHENLIYLKQQL